MSVTIHLTAGYMQIRLIHSWHHPCPIQPHRRYGNLSDKDLRGLFNFQYLQLFLPADNKCPSDIFKRYCKIAEEVYSDLVDWWFLIQQSILFFILLCCTLKSCVNTCLQKRWTGGKSENNLMKSFLSCSMFSFFDIFFAPTDQLIARE